MDTDERNAMNEATRERKQIKRQLAAAWMELIRATFDHRCVICGIRGGEAAHLIGKGSNPSQRYEQMNGVILCRLHHDWIDGRSGLEPKTSAWRSIERLEPARYEYAMENQNKIIPHRTNGELRELLAKLQELTKNLLTVEKKGGSF